MGGFTSDSTQLGPFRFFFRLWGPLNLNDISPGLFLRGCLVTVLTIFVPAPPQGLPEHPPISSTAHPILVPGQGSTVDAALHLGLVLADGAGVPWTRGSQSLYTIAMK